MSTHWNFRKILDVNPERDERCVAIRVKVGTRCNIRGFTGRENLAKAGRILDTMDRTKSVRECRAQLDDLAYLMMCGNPHRKMESVRDDRVRRWNGTISEYVVEVARERKREKESQAKEVLRLEKKKVIETLLVEKEDANKTPIIKMKKAQPKAEVKEPQSFANQHLGAQNYGLPSPPDSIRLSKISEVQNNAPLQSPQETPTKPPPSTNKSPDLNPTSEVTATCSKNTTSEKTNRVLKFGAERTSPLETFNFCFADPNSALKLASADSAPKSANNSMSITGFGCRINASKTFDFQLPQDVNKAKSFSSSLARTEPTPVKFTFQESLEAPNPQEILKRENSRPVGLPSSPPATPVVAVDLKQKRLPDFNKAGPVELQDITVLLSPSKSKSVLEKEKVSSSPPKETSSSMLPTSYDGNFNFEIESQYKVPPKCFGLETRAETSFGLKLTYKLSSIWNLPLGQKEVEIQHGGEEVDAGTEAMSSLDEIEESSEGDLVRETSSVSDDEILRDKGEKEIVLNSPLETALDVSQVSEVDNLEIPIATSAAADCKLESSKRVVPEDNRENLSPLYLSEPSLIHEGESPEAIHIADTDTPQETPSESKQPIDQNIAPPITTQEVDPTPSTPTPTPTSSIQNLNKLNEELKLKDPNPNPKETNETTTPILSHETQLPPAPRTPNTSKPTKPNSFGHALITPERRYKTRFSERQAEAEIERLRNVYELENDHDDRRDGLVEFGTELDIEPFCMPAVYVPVSYSPSQSHAAHLLFVESLDEDENRRAIDRVQDTRVHEETGENETERVETPRVQKEGRFNLEGLNWENDRGIPTKSRGRRRKQVWRKLNQGFSNVAEAVRRKSGMDV